MTEAEFFDLYHQIISRHKSPLIELDASQGEVFVPREFINDDGSIVLNLSPKAVRSLKVLNDVVYCRASFKSQVFSLSFPLANIIDIFEEDNEGQGKL
ncbi:MAG: ClpXP protease specificity-enhancing factor SspB [Gammaproteobacteria bacterium]|nr:ClpXP protease specificity-enhancing factor SspB [Gammaproteobacteria bacterium]